MKLPCTLKLRHTGSDTKGGGVGPMVTENLSCTLAAAVQDQTLITGGTLCYDGYNQRAYKDVSMTMRSAMTGTEGNDADPKVAYGFANDAQTGFPIMTETAQTQKNGTAPGHESGVVQSIGFKAGQSANGGLGDEREVAPTLSHTPSALEPTVAHFARIGSMTRRDRPTPPSKEVAQPLTSSDGNIGDNAPMAVISALLSQMRYIVRRLSPVECERLMGLPDNYTIPAALREGFADGAPSPSLVAEFQRIFDTFGAIMHEYALAAYNRNHREGEPPPKPPKPKSAAFVNNWLKKITNPATCPDSPRYKACGNGWATNQPRWILTRLLALDGIDPFTPAMSRPQGESLKSPTFKRNQQ